VFSAKPRAGWCGAGRCGADDHQVAVANALHTADHLAGFGLDAVAGLGGCQLCVRRPVLPAARPGTEVGTHHQLLGLFHAGVAATILENWASTPTPPVPQRGSRPVSRSPARPRPYPARSSPLPPPAACKRLLPLCGPAPLEGRHVRAARAARQRRPARRARVSRIRLAAAGTRRVQGRACRARRRADRRAGQR